MTVLVHQLGRARKIIARARTAAIRDVARDGRRDLVESGGADAFLQLSLRVAAHGRVGLHRDIVRDGAGHTWRLRGQYHVRVLVQEAYQICKDFEVSHVGNIRGG